MLRERYSAVIFANGALKDKELGWEGEHSIRGVLHARRVVNWYNGSLDHDLDVENEFDIHNAKNLTVIGNGNISCDIIRILLKDPDQLRGTDMPEDAIKFL